MARPFESKPSDTDVSLNDIRSHRIRQLLEIQKHRIVEEKSLGSLQCLVKTWSVGTARPTKILRRTQISDYRFQRRYVAVSYTWEPSGNENHAVGGYEIESEDGQFRTPSDVRDVVLDRVTKYAAWRGVGPFFIDRLSINQDDSDEKEIAIQSMDLVYSFSDFPLGLLSAKVESSEQLDLLRGLLHKDFILDYTPPQYPMLAREIDAETAFKVVELLHHITSDPWWDRAWIFQEDYRSSVKMCLLIPHVPSLRKEHVPTELGGIPGELRINSAEFHTAATEFCLAYLQRAKTKKHRQDGASMCEEILAKAGKYNILHRYLYKAVDGEIRKGMSSTIFADIGRRSITVPSDLLAIAANCCDYSVRLNTKTLGAQDCSLDLCILALYLLNGEIVRNDKINKTAVSTNIFQYLNKQSLDTFDPPVYEKELTFIKSCRFVDVELSPEGITTTGRLWTLHKAIDTTADIFQKRFRPDRDVSSRGLTYYQRSRLQQLILALQHMKPKHHNLINDIVNYLKEDTYSNDYEAPSKKYKDAMAEQVVEAIRQGKTLQLGCLLGTNPYRGVFISEPRQEQDSKPSYIFTAYSPAGKQSGNIFSASNIDKIISLEVDMDGYWEGLPRLRTKRWVNGLCFFEQSSSKKVVFPWPF